MRTASVGDQLIFDRVLSELPELDRAAVDRALASGGYKTGITREHVDDAYQRGYDQGRSDAFAAYRRKAAQAAESKDKK